MTENYEVHIEPQQVANGLGIWDSATETLESRWKNISSQIDIALGSNPWGTDSAGNNFRTSFVEKGKAGEFSEIGHKMVKTIRKVGDDARASVEASLASDKEQAAEVGKVNVPNAGGSSAGGGSAGGGAGMSSGGGQASMSAGMMTTGGSYAQVAPGQDSVMGTDGGQIRTGPGDHWTKLDPGRGYNLPEGDYVGGITPEGNQGADQLIYDRMPIGETTNVMGDGGGENYTAPDMPDHYDSVGHPDGPASNPNDGTTNFTDVPLNYVDEHGNSLGDVHPVTGPEPTNIVPGGRAPSLDNVGDAAPPAAHGGGGSGHGGGGGVSHDTATYGTAAAAPVAQPPPSVQDHQGALEQIRERLDERFPNGMGEQQLPDGLAENLPEGPADHLPEGMTEHISEGLRQDVSEGVAQHVPEGLGQHVPDGPAGMQGTDEPNDGMQLTGVQGEEYLASLGHGDDISIVAELDDVKIHDDLPKVDGHTDTVEGAI